MSLVKNMIGKANIDAAEHGIDEIETAVEGLEKGVEDLDAKVVEIGAQAAPFVAKVAPVMGPALQRVIGLIPELKGVFSDKEVNLVVSALTQLPVLVDALHKANVAAEARLKDLETELTELKAKVSSL